MPLTHYQRKVFDASRPVICDDRTIASRVEQFLLSAPTECGRPGTSLHSVSVVPSTAGGAAVDATVSGTAVLAGESAASVTGVSGRLDSGSLYMSHVTANFTLLESLVKTQDYITRFPRSVSTPQLLSNFRGLPIHKQLPL